MLAFLAWPLATLPLRPLLLVIGGITAAILLLRWPWLIWPGLALALPVTSGLKFGPASATDLILLVALALWFADGVRRRTLKLRGSILTALLLLYVGVLYLSLLGAINLGEATVEMVKWLEVIVVLVLVRAMLPAIHASWLVVALLVAGVSQAVWGIYQFIFQIGPAWFIILGRFMRASGSFHQPNPYAGYLGLSLPVAVSLMLWAWRCLLTGQGKRRQALLWLVFTSLSTGVIGAGLLASWSRGGWLGGLTGVGLVVVLRSRLAALSSAVVILLVLCALLLGSFKPDVIPAPLIARLQDIPAYFGLTDIVNQPVNDDNFAVIERLAHWVAAVRMWEKAPWLGVGPGNYATVYPSVRLPLWEEPLGHAHNIYLNVLAETGLVGLGAYLLLWISAAIWVWRHFQQAAQRQASWHAAVALGVLGVISHVSVHNIFDNLFVQGIYLQMGLWLALLSIGFTVWPRASLAPADERPSPTVI